MKAPGNKPRYKEPGWCLALHHFAGDGPEGRQEGVEVERAEPLPPELHDRPWLYCGDELLGAENWRELVRDWQDHVGTLALWVSDCRYTEKPGARVTREGLRAALDRPGWELLEDEIVAGRALLVYRRLGAGEASSLRQKLDAFVERPWRKAEKHCLVIRGGAYGDVLMASSVLPALKAEGWTIDFACNEYGHEVLRCDPHVDRFLVARKGFVTDHNIGAYWQALGARYDRVVNLSYTVEHTLLKRPWDGAYFWPHETRKRLCAGSYLANNHAVAGVPLPADGAPFRVKFYPSPAEAEAAAKIAAGLGPFALWALRGSAVHKWYPFAPQVAVRLLVQRPDLALVFSGGPDSAELEGKILDTVIEFLGPAAAKRIHSMVGTGSIRRVLALAQRARVVIGPETGVLNAVGQEAVPKVCLLSHSAPSNLTDDWVNAVPVVPDVAAAPCWPCHRLHHAGHEHCPQDPRTLAAACQAAIGPERVMAAIAQALLLTGEAARRPEASRPPPAALDFRSIDDPAGAHAPVVPKFVKGNGFLPSSPTESADAAHQDPQA